MILPALSVLHVDSGREYRGGQNQLRLLLTGLARRSGVRQALLTRRNSRIAAEAAGLGLPIFPVRWRGAVDGDAVASLVRRNGSNWDLIHAHDGHAVQSVLLARGLSGGRSPVVAARRVDFAPRNPNVWQRADLVIAVSARIRDVLVENGIDRSRIEVVHSGIDPAELEPAAGVLRSAAGAPPGELLIAAVGALVPHKDHATFVRAAALVAARHPSVRFAVFGEGSERKRLSRLIENLALGDRFRLVGEVPGAARSLDDIDIFVMPSREEGLGTACIEAMHAGRPVVATRAGGIGELAIDGSFEPVEPENPEALAAGIERLVGSPEARQEAGRLASAGAGRFTADAMVSGTLRCYLALSRRAE